MLASNGEFWSNCGAHCFDVPFIFPDSDCRGVMEDAAPFVFYSRLNASKCKNNTSEKEEKA